MEYLYVFTAASIESQSSATDQIGCLRLGKPEMPGAQGTSTPLSDQSSASAEPCTQSQGEWSNCEQAALNTRQILCKSSLEIFL